jgi:hypothetical protein
LSDIFVVLLKVAQDIDAQLLIQIFGTKRKAAFKA